MGTRYEASLLATNFRRAEFHPCQPLPRPVAIQAFMFALAFLPLPLDASKQVATLGIRMENVTRQFPLLSGEEALRLIFPTTQPNIQRM